MKKLVFLFVCCLVISMVGMIAYADDNVLQVTYPAVGNRVYIDIGNAEYLDFGDGKLVAVSSLPKFNSKAEANAFIDDFIDDASCVQIDNGEKGVATYATRADVLVAKRYSGMFDRFYIELRLSYTTSGDGNTGTITRHDAYTTYGGVTAGISWDERMCTSEITSSGLDVYCHAAGVVSGSLLIDGLMELYSEPVTISGTAWVIRS